MTAAFCVTGCNLGCAREGCAITEIAQNQPLTFTFSQDVDPRSVDFSTFSLKTPTGEEPVGDFVVEGATVTFVPEVRSIQGLTFFGFTANQTYVLTLPGGPSVPKAIVSTSGDRLAESVTCNLRISGGVVDLDGQPPRAKLVSPAQSLGVPRNTNVVLEFSELIDFGPFFNTSGLDAPIVFKVRKTLLSNGNPICDGASREFVLTGAAKLRNEPVRGVTTVSFQPVESLPGLACVEVEVTTRVVDLSGKKAVPQTFRFVLEPGSPKLNLVTEDFQNDLRMDRPRSGGVWSGGEARFTTLGGDGRHGDFDITDGTKLSDKLFVWDTTSVTIARKVTGTINRDDTVTDGHFYFTNFFLPEDVTLRLVGPHPVRFFVRGVVDIRGKILATGAHQPGDHNSKNSVKIGTSFTPGPGQKGSRGGAGGGNGGNGAFACDGDGNPNRPQFNNFNGFHGDDVVVPATHAFYPQRIGTGGRGSPLFPTSGAASQLTYRALQTYAIEATSGGGGGGFITAGGPGQALEGGRVSSEPKVTGSQFLAADTPGGIAFPPLLPVPGGRASSEHLLVGGAGGGGGGSQATFAHVSNATDPFKFWSGGGGAGGGGVFCLRAGGSFTIGSKGLLDCSGGSGDTTATAFSVGRTGAPAPGGGGAGGSALLQVAGSVTQLGSISVAGGAGIPLNVQGFFIMQSAGGKGSDGFLRLEVPDANPSLAMLGTTVPAAQPNNIATVAERDGLAGFMSLWRATGEVFPPDYLRYEIDAVVDGVARVFSDDPSVPAGTPALQGSAPLVFLVQGVDVDAQTAQPLPNSTPAPWRKYVGSFGQGSGELGLSSDATTGFRWVLLFDTTKAASVVVKRVSVVFRS